MTCLYSYSISVMLSLGRFIDQIGYLTIIHNNISVGIDDKFQMTCLQLYFWDTIYL